MHARLSLHLPATLAFGLLLAPSPATAAGKAAKPPAEKKVPSDVKPAVAAPAAAAPVTAQPDPNATAETLLRQGQKLYKEMEFERAIPLANAALARPEITPNQKLDAYVLQGSCYAIIGETLEAEKAFRMLLRGRPEYDLPADTAPKILSLFRKVQTEERSIRDQLRALEAENTVKGLKLLGNHPTEAPGGRPLQFGYRLQDPTAAVDTMRVMYRRQSESAYAFVAMKRDAEGVWRGAVPAEWTASESGFTAEFYVLTAGPLGELLRDGSAAKPFAVKVSAGSANRKAPPPLPLWSFVAATGVTGLIGLGAAGSGIAFALVQNQYRTVAGATPEVDGRALRSIGDSGENLALSTNVLMIAAAAAALVAGGMAPFTNWTGETAEQAATAPMP